jgi:hypothetical protein
MRILVSLFFLVGFFVASSLAQWASPSAVRGQFGNMTTAKISSIPDFVLPAIYTDRTAHPLPATVNHETDAAAKLYMPPVGWCIDGWSCANASAVSFSYDYAVQTYKLAASSGQYPMYTYNFTYHFMDNANQATGGDGWMYVEAFDILKAMGCPTSTDFGGFGPDGDNVIDNNVNIWMSGYDKYYTAMKIRVDEYYKIDPGTTHGDSLIKQIVYDYADGSPAGAILSFQANSESMPTTTISGRKTLTGLGGGGGHALSICGYDNTFNGGCWLCQAHWGTGDYWLPYTMLHSGSSWYNNPSGNGHVMFCRLKKNYTPKFAFKVSITESQRNQICIQTGAANATTATQPSTSKDCGNAFNYGGGSVPMCGTGKSSTMEIGFDLTDFTSTVAAGQGTFFLKVSSKGGSGTVNSLALEDYTGASVREIACTQTNVPITSSTVLSIPWTGTIPSAVEQKKVAASHQGNGLAASFAAGSQMVKFSFPGDNMRTAILHITDLTGRTVLTKACPNAGTASWDLRDFFGRTVSNGAYLASVTVQGRDGSSRQLSTKVLVRD